VRRLFAALGRTVAGAIVGALVGFCGLIFVAPICIDYPARPGDEGSTYLGLIVCLTLGPALGILVAHLCLRRPSPPPKDPSPAHR
jgi:hypothetical protein